MNENCKYENTFIAFDPSFMNQFDGRHMQQKKKKKPSHFRWPVYPWTVRKSFAVGNRIASIQVEKKIERPDHMQVTSSLISLLPCEKITQRF